MARPPTIRCRLCVDHRLDHRGEPRTNVLSEGRQPLFPGRGTLLRTVVGQEPVDRQAAPELPFKHPHVPRLIVAGRWAVLVPAEHSEGPDRIGDIEYLGRHLQLNGRQPHGPREVKVPEELTLDVIPHVRSLEPAIAVPEAADRWHPAAVEQIPLLRKPTVGWRHPGDRGIELRGRQRGGERYPAAPTAAQQRQEVQVWGQLPATLNLVDADLHGLLVERSLVAHPPSQVDGLKSPPAQSAVVLQRTERALLQCPALLPISANDELTNTRNRRGVPAMDLLLEPVRSVEPAPTPPSSTSP